MEFLLKLLRMLHMVLGITPAEPERERFYLLLWAAALAAISVVVIIFALLLIPHIMH